MLEPIPFKTGYDFTGEEEGRTVPTEDAANLEKTSPLKATFSRSALKEILDQPEHDCVGIRFYTEKTADNQDTIAAVGLDTFRERLESKIVMGVPQTPSELTAEKVIAPFTAFFSKDQLMIKELHLSDDLVVIADALEVEIMGIHSTFTIANVVTEGTANYVQSTAPCPPDCGGGTYKIKHL